MAKIDFRKELRKIEEMIRQDRIRAEKNQQRIDALVVQIQSHYEQAKDAQKALLKKKN